MHLNRLVAATVLATVLLPVAACRKEPSPTAAAGAPASGTAAPAATGIGTRPATETDTAATTAPSAKPPAAGPQAAIGDGRWPAFVTAVGDGELTMDLVEFLTGDAAVKAWQKKYPDSDEKTPPNDYMIVNDNPKKRVLPLAKTVTVKVVGGGVGGVANKTVGLDGLKDRIPDTLFWLTVKGGKVTLVQEQFLP
ncbi:hypothetical protein AB0J80_20270 [Actinoplanes sp. NPDC049548]|uniref:hypothetical protein n=1 Tax=Actinoplanes sp. NPDC049548 TaxID=3155152 RepID=UPI00344908DC